MRGLFCIPLQFKIAGKSGDGTATPDAEFDCGITVDRGTIFTALQGDAHYKTLVQGPDGATKDNFYRIVSPNRATTAGLTSAFPADYYDAYIDYCWTKVFAASLPNPGEIYAVNINPNAVPVGTPTLQYTAKMNANDELVFTAQEGSAGKWTDCATVTVAKPTNKQVLMNEIAATATGAKATDAKNFVVAQLGADTGQKDREFERF